MPRQTRKQTTIRAGAGESNVTKPASPVTAAPPYVQYVNVRADRSAGAAQLRVGEALKGFGRSVAQVAVKRHEQDIKRRRLRGQADALKNGAPADWLATREQILADPERGQAYWDAYSEQGASLAAVQKASALSDELAAREDIADPDTFNKWWSDNNQKDIEAIKELDDPKAMIAYLTRMEEAEIKARSVVSKRQADNIYMQTETDFNMLAQSDLGLILDKQGGHTLADLVGYIEAKFESGTALGLSKQDANEGIIRAVGEEALRRADPELLDVFTLNHADGTPGQAFTKKGGAMVRQYRKEATTAFDKAVAKQLKKEQYHIEITAQQLIRDGKTEEARVYIDEQVESGALPQNRGNTLYESTFTENKKAVRIAQNTQKIRTGDTLSVRPEHRQETIDNYGDEELEEARATGNPEILHETTKDIIATGAQLGTPYKPFKDRMAKLNLNDPEEFQAQLELATTIRGVSENAYIEMVPEKTRMLIAATQRLAETRTGQREVMVMLQELQSPDGERRRKELAADTEAMTKLRKKAASDVGQVGGFLGLFDEDVQNIDEVTSWVTDMAVDYAAYTGQDLEDAYAFAKQEYEGSFSTIKLGNGRGYQSVYTAKLGLPSDITDQLEWASEDLTAEYNAKLEAEGKEADPSRSWYLLPDPASRHESERQFLVVDNLGRIESELRDGVAVPKRIPLSQLSQQYHDEKNRNGNEKWEANRMRDDVQYESTYPGAAAHRRAIKEKQMKELQPEDTQEQSVTELFTQDYRDFYAPQPPRAVPAAPEKVEAGQDVGPRLVREIAEGEGTGDAQARRNGFNSGYDVPYGYGKFAKPSRPISHMTVGEVREFQRKQIEATKGKVPGTSKGTGAVGKYQVTFGTLKDMQKTLGFKDSDVFDADLQDRIGVELLNKRGYQKYMNGEISKEEFQLNLAKEWASIADPSTGKSYYGQATGTTLEELEDILN